MIERYVLHAVIHFSDNKIQVLHRIFDSRDKALLIAQNIMANYGMLVTELKLFNLYTSEVIYHV